LCILKPVSVSLLLWLVDSDEGAIDRTNWASGNVGAALHAADLVATWRHDAINCVCVTYDALRKKIGQA
jgi:hypothetical protein